MDSDDIFNEKEDDELELIRAKRMREIQKTYQQKRAGYAELR